MILSGAVSACGAINLSPEIDLLGDLTAHKAECASKLPTTAYSPEYFSPVVKEGMFGNLGQKPYLEAAGSAIDLVAQKILKKGLKPISMVFLPI